jgi:hypothetical protein
MQVVVVDQAKTVERREQHLVAAAEMPELLEA